MSDVGAFKETRKTSVKFSYIINRTEEYWKWDTYITHIHIRHRMMSLDILFMIKKALSWYRWIKAVRGNESQPWWQ